jgi:beta-phosphoglucomutase-like phosphatase (HAD superfamily)
LSRFGGKGISRLGPIAFLHGFSYLRIAQRRDPMRKLGYEGWFDPIVCADDLAHAKPAPDGLLKALVAIQVRPGQALVFEDTAFGFEAARAQV